MDPHDSRLVDPVTEVETKRRCCGDYIGYDQGWAVFQIHVFEIQNTILYFVFKYLLKKYKCILYLNTFNLSIFVFSKCIK